MDVEILKSFINHDVEVLIAGVWIEGHMTPIVKGVVTLLPLADVAPFYGPAACKTDVIQAIRQVRRLTTQAPVDPVPTPTDPTQIRSSLDQVSPQQRFARK
jgi:hypothetical protein